MSTQPKTPPKTIEILADAVYPSFAMLAGMELDVFTPLKGGPLTADQIARAVGTDPAKTAPLLHALVAIGLLKFDGDRFLNSPEADQFLVRGSPDYIGMRHHAYRRRWNSVLCVAETIRAGVPQRGMDYASMPAEARSPSIGARLPNVWQQAGCSPDRATSRIFGVLLMSGEAPAGLLLRWRRLGQISQSRSRTCRQSRQLHNATQTRLASQHASTFVQPIWSVILLADHTI